MLESKGVKNRLRPDKTAGPEGKNERMPWLRIIGLSAVLLLLVAIGIFAFIHRGWIFSPGPAAWGQFGDYVGGVVGSVFAGLALAALLWSINLQQRELHIASDQLKVSAEALTEQAKTLARQNFEQTFFALIELLNANRTAITNRDPKDAVDKAFEKYSEFLDRRGAEDKEAAKSHSAKLSRHVDQTLGHVSSMIRWAYSPFLNTLLECSIYIAEHAHPELVNLYRSILRAQFNSREIVFLLLYAAAGDDRLARLIERDDFLSSFDPDACGPKIAPFGKAIHARVPEFELGSQALRWLENH